MNTQIETVKKYFESLETGDLKTLGSLFDENAVWHQPGQGSLSKVYHGKSEIFPLFGKFMEISEGSFKIDAVKTIMVNGDFVTATLRFSARKSNGQKIEMDGIDLMKVENGLIKDVYLFSADQEAEDQFWGR